LAGFNPRSAVRIAFSITPISDLSQGWTVSSRGSGADTVPT
jgi:hypothetical protein